MADVAHVANDHPVVTPLSDVHRVLATLERQHHARFLNRVANDPSVYRWVRGYATGALDLTNVVANPANVLLAGEYGCILFVEHQPGLFEAHTQILPDGRGAWAVLMVRAALMWMFTRTNAVEILTKCPQGNTPALALAKRIGGRFEFTNPRGWIMDNDPIPADIYALRIQDWMHAAPGLAERGHWFHEKLEAEYARHGKADPEPHPEDDNHDRYVGAACEMFIGGQIDKAVIFYNRWSVMAGYEPVSVMSRDPLTIDIRDALLIVRPDGEFYAATVRTEA